MPTYCDEAPGFNHSVLVRLCLELHAFTQHETEDCDHSEDCFLKNGLWLCRQCGATWSDEED